MSLDQFIGIIFSDPNLLGISGIVLICAFALLWRIMRFCWIVYIRPLPEVDIVPSGVGGYWCVVCGRFLRAQDGLIIHDNVPHPPTMAFDDEDRPQ